MFLVRSCTWIPRAPSFRGMVALLVVLWGFGAPILSAQVHTNTLGYDVVFLSGTPQWEPNRPPSSGPYSFQEQVQNVSTGSRAIDMTCIKTGPITCSSVSPSSATLTAGQILTLTVTYSATATSGAGSAGASVSINDGAGPSRSRTITVAPIGYAGVRMVDTNVAFVDRGRCLTLGAGENAGISCGDLFVTAGMPAYRALGRDRSPTLYYNSAAATGLVLVPARVKEASSIALPTSVTAFFSLAGATDTIVMAPPAYNPNCTTSPCAPYSDSQQVVFARWLTTGYYQDTLTIRNLYGASLRDSTVRGKVLVLNRSTSEYGQGWSLLGIEQLLTVPWDSTKRIWVDGDGSMRVYSKRLPGDSVFVGAPGAAPDSLIRYTKDTTGVKWFVRNLKHRVLVRFDETGHHRVTQNRAGEVTTFFWGTVAGQTRLTSIVVPPNGADSLKYTLQWDNATAAFKGITDPTGRQLLATVTAGRLVKLIQPGLTDTTRFAYDAKGRMTSRAYPREVGTTVGDSAVTNFYYGNSARVTRVEIQADAAGLQFQTVIDSNWDEKGLGTLRVTTDSLGLPTRYDGPLGGTYDAMDFWVDRFGQPTRTKHVGLATTTWFSHDSSATPELVTKVVYPHPTASGATGRVVRMDWNARGNLTQVKDTSTALDSVAPRVTQYLYDTSPTAPAPDAPIQVTDPLNRSVLYAYDSLGFLEHTYDTRQHTTKYYVRGSGSFTGVLDSVFDYSVTTWQQSAHDTTSSPLTQKTLFWYDAKGNMLASADPAGGLTGYINDYAGRVIDVYDAAKVRTSREYDALNRVTKIRTLTGPTATLPAPLLGLSTCSNTHVTCALSAWSQDTVGDSLITTLTQGRIGVTTVTDPRGVGRTYRRDARGAVVGETDDYGASIISSDSVVGLLVSTQLRTGSLVRYKYDPYGRLTDKVFPPQTTRSKTVPGDSVHYTYDLVGRVLTMSNVTATITQTYFANGALRSRILSAPVDTLRFTYDLSGARKSMYHAVQSSVSTIPNPVRDSLAYSYAPSGDLQAITVYVDTVEAATVAWGMSRTFGFAYDQLGRRRQITYPVRGLKVNLAYDIRGHLRRVDAAPTTAPSTSNQHGDILNFTTTDDSLDVAGRLLFRSTRCTRAQSSNWGGSECQTPSMPFDSVSYAYSWRHMLTRQAFKQSSERHLKRYDGSGNLIGTVDTTGIFSEVHHLNIPSGHNRLTIDSTVVGPQYPPMFMVYDASGSRVIDSSYSGGALDTRTRVQFYDGSGRMSGLAFISGGGWNIQENSCLYYPDGQFSHPCGSSPTLVYDGNNVIGTRYATMSMQIVQAGSLDDPLMAIGRNHVGWFTYYYVSDGQGQLLAASDSNGDQVYNDTQGDWRGWQWSGGTSNAKSFQASRMNTPETPDVSMFRNRAYDSRSGRWLQEDPIGLSGGINLYQFNGNNPAMFSDPFGLVLEYKGGSQADIDECRKKSTLCNAFFSELAKSKVKYTFERLGKGKDWGMAGCGSGGCTQGQVKDNKLLIQYRPDDFEPLQKKNGVKVDGAIIVGHEAGHAVSVTEEGTMCTDPQCAITSENIIRSQFGDEYGKRAYPKKE